MLTLHHLQVHRYQQPPCGPIPATSIVHQTHSVEPLIGPRQPLQSRPSGPCSGPILEHHKQLNQQIISAESADAILQLVCEQVCILVHPGLHLCLCLFRDICCTQACTLPVVRILE